MIALDTSYIISLARGSQSIRNTLQQVDYEGGVITSISHFEIFGSNKKMKEEEKKYFANLFNTYPVISFDIKASEASSRIWSDLEKIGRRVNVLDTLIAGVILSNGINSMITSDKDFLEIAKVTDLQVIMI